MAETKENGDSEFVVDPGKVLGDIVEDGEVDGELLAAEVDDRHQRYHQDSVVEKQRLEEKKIWILVISDLTEELIPGAEEHWRPASPSCRDSSLARSDSGKF